MRLIQLILSIIFIFNVTGCEQRIRPSVVEVETQELPSQESWDSTIIISEDGKVSAIIKAGYIAVYSEKDVTILEEDIVVDFYNEEGEITSTLTAKRGEVDDATNNLSAYNDVVVVSDDGTVLKTEILYWNNAQEKVHTDQFVEITSPDEIIYGYGLESDSRLQNYTIYRVTGKTRPQQ